jgi:UDPglucose 6-dehydrogenase
VEAVNEAQKKFLIQKIRSHFGNRLKGLTFALWGLAFKPNTDDMRSAPSLVIIEELLAAGAAVRAYDPVAMDEARRILGDRPGFTTVSGANEALQGADALAIVTEWREFRSPDFDQIKAALKHPVIFDGRNLYSPDLLRELGFSHYSVGRKDVQLIRDHKKAH